VAVPIAVLLAFTVSFAGFALWRFRVGETKILRA
jgi:hypothetical protein